jgi:hypothetical protein
MANPLSLFMPLLPDANLKELAAMLATSQQQIDDGLKAVGTVHYARFLVLDRSQGNLQPGSDAGPFVLAVITEYDGSFTAYIQDFVAQMAPIFNALLAFVDTGGVTVTPVQDNINAFTLFIQQNDASQHAPNNGGGQPGGGLYSAYSQTVQQILAAFPSQ